MTEETAARRAALLTELDYLFADGMTDAQRLGRLSDAYFQAWNAGYGDAMANRLMAGKEDEQTRLWEKNCRHKYAIDELIGLLKETEGRHGA